MHPAALLSAWEAGAARPAPDRALLLLVASYPEHAAEAWAALPVGRRDAWLMALRERLFGPRLEMVANCPRCAEGLEVEMSLADVRVSPPPVEPPCEFEHDGVRVAFRLPTSHDLSAVVREGEAALLARCVEASAEGRPLAPSEIPAPVLAALDARLEEADPQAVVDVALDCPACGHGWSVRFDILATLWGEVEGWAAGLLRDVHALAAAYGWTEGDVLALSPLRRRLYREMVGA